jgi:hypothetical protein
VPNRSIKRTAKVLLRKPLAVTHVQR